MDYDVVIIGAGPAGIFTALTLADLGLKKVLLVDQGKDITDRKIKSPEDRLCGWGGAGAFSDGKLILSTEVGGSLKEYIEEKTLYDLLVYTDKIYSDYGAPNRIFGEDSKHIERLSDMARSAGLEFLPTRIRHIGTENCRAVLERLKISLSDRINIRTEVNVQDLIVNDGRVQGIKLENGQYIASDFVVVAPGRSGAGWMKMQVESIGLIAKSTTVDIGVRVELPAPVLKKITDMAHESKLVHYSKTFDDKIRTFCMNPFGEVVTEENEGIVTVNGHSYAGKRSENTNFAILVSSMFTEPFDDPIAYGQYIARLANLLSGGVIIQRLGDFLSGRRSTQDRIDRCLTRPTLKDAVPGDLSFVLPYRHLLNIIEMLQALDKIAPGVSARHTLLYGVEVKFYSNRIKVTSEMETEIKNLFAIGDGAGVTRGLLQASASGVLAARAIYGRLV